MAASAGAPVGVLSGGSGGLAVCSRIRHVLPHEDVLLLADHAYAPYARRPGRVVIDRALRMAEDLMGDGAKLLVLASAQATADALDAVRARLAVPVVGLDGIVPHAAARAAGRPVALVTGAGCLRGLQLARALKHERGGAQVASDPWPGLAELVEGGGDARRLVSERVAGLRAADVGAIALGCAHASAVRALVAAAAGPDLPVLDASDLAAERVRRTLVRSGMLARRRRAGRQILLSSHPARGQRGLAAYYH